MSVTSAPPDQRLLDALNKLRHSRHAVILAHNYQLAEVQDVADFTGDSLELSRQAAKTDAEVIVFCGVLFMAETAAILSPEKTVLIPDPRAGCPLANMITADQLRRLRSQHPGVPVVSYVNTSAEVKAESDYCCTSANAIKVVEGVPADRVIFVPDRNLADWVARHTPKQIIPWNGHCATHHRILAEDIRRRRQEYPGAEVMVHPESTPDVIELADQVLSTGGMIRHARESAAKVIVVGTENGLIHRLQKEAPDKQFIPASRLAVCPNMKRTTLDKVLWSLEDLQHRVEVSEEIRVRARGAIDRMLAIV